MNGTLYDRWLYESESDSLDFKRDQYKFIKASELDKSELLKDILSMANSWRRVDGYIVIGVEDKPEKPNNILGITEHIDDADLQQFVNSKVSRTCLFEYSTYTNEGKTLGIIIIPVQKRPIYLTKNYGALKADTVYVKRGSSTDIAKPDEVSKMGLNNEEIANATLDVGFLNISTNQIIGNLLKYETSLLIIRDKIPEHSKNVSGMLPVIGMNRSYYKDFVEFVNFKFSYIPIHFAIVNTGEKEAVNIRFELEINNSDVEVLLDGDEIEQPEPEGFYKMKSINSPVSSYRYEKFEAKCKIYNAIDRLHAKRTLALDGTVYLQAKKSMILKAKATLFYDGQSKPFEKELEIRIECKSIELNWKEFYEQMFKKKD